jgi:hypothetical protein
MRVIVGRFRRYSTFCCEWRVVSCVGWVVEDRNTFWRAVGVFGCDRWRSEGRRDCSPKQWSKKQNTFVSELFILGKLFE